MLSEAEFNELLSDLQAEDVGRRVKALRHLSGWPTGDIRLLPFVEILLNDRTPIVIGVPLRYGELRLLAAFALHSERALAGINEPVKLPGTFYPMDAYDIGELAKKAGIEIGEFPTPGERTRATLRKLLEKGLVPLYDLEDKPTDSRFWKGNFLAHENPE